MDASVEYIKMCGKTEEIQKKWIPKLGDYIHVEWNPKSSSAGLECCLLQDRPCYGIGYEFYHNMDNNIDKFYYYNGSRGKDETTDEYRKPFKQTIAVMSDFKSLVWLPRQDQLQNIISPYLQELLDTICEKDGDIGYQFMHEYDLNSMEQLWLAFVMKEKYKKTWDGEQWTQSS